MKLLILSRYSRLGASSRLRMLQYIPSLSSAGVEVEVRPFVNDNYIERLYSGERQNLAKLWYVASRTGSLLTTGKPDLIWIEKEVLPWIPWPIERMLLPRNVPIVADYDDAVFHQYDLHKNAAVRQFLGRKIDGVMARADLVLAGNKYLSERAKVAGAERVEIVPTVVDVDTYSSGCRPTDDQPLKIGWIGSPGTWRDYMIPRLPMLASIAKKHGAMIRAVGADHTARSSSELELLPWSEDTEVSMIHGMDIGIMPLDDTPWARGKCGYKLIQYMACGLPVIASPVGVNAEIVEHGVNGFLATNESEWREALTKLLQNPDLCRRMGAEGRRKVEREYSLQVWGPRVVQTLTGL